MVSQEPKGTSPASPATSEPGATIVRRVQEEGGPISFAEFMELALYGTGGYYEHPPIGVRGDYVTSPHVHPLFAEMLAVWITREAERLDSGMPLTVVEVGAGDGTLARQLLEALAPSDISLTYIAVERSGGARTALAAIEGVRVADEIPDAFDLLIAHELLDNLPFRRLRMTDEGLREVYVDAASDSEGIHRFREVLEEPAAEVAAAITEELEPGDETAYPEAALRLIDDIAERMRGREASALLIDYGGDGTTGGPPHGYRGHHVVDDLVSEPGTTDVTSGIDFRLIAERAEARGLSAQALTTQRQALTELGFMDRINAELERQAEYLNAGRGAEAVQIWSQRNAAMLLVDPSALGRLKWLTLRSEKRS